MPRSYWLPIVAAVGLILTGSENVSAQSHPSVHRYSGGQSAPQQTASNPSVKAPPTAPAIENGVNRIATALEAQIADAKSPEEKKRTQDNLDSQRRMADAAETMMWVAGAEVCITTLGVIVTILGVIFVWKTLGANRDAVRHARRAANAAWKSVKTTREIGQKQVRAYLSCEGATFAIERDWMVCRPLIKNYGQSPATEIKIDMVVSSREVIIEPLVPERAKIHQSEEFMGTCSPIPAGCEERAMLLWSHVELNGQIERLAHEHALFWLIGSLTWTDVFGTVDSAVVTLSLTADQIGLTGDTILRSGELSAFVHDPETKGNNAQNSGD